MNKRIFITGGTGFFGKSILSMIQRGFKNDSTFVILSRDPKSFLNQYNEFANLPNVSFHAGDVRYFSFPDGEFDEIIHAATPAVLGLADDEMESIIIDGTKRVIQFAKHCGAKKIMMTSSGAVYGIQDPELDEIAESSKCKPVTTYGIAKLKAEKLCIESGIYTLLPRCFAFVGAYLNRDIHFAIGNFIKNALAEEPIIINGDGTPFRSYMYADDLVEWLFAILERGESGTPYNVGSDNAVSIYELAKIVKETLNSNNEIIVKQKANPNQKAPRYIPNISLAKSLGLQERFTLQEAILATCNKF